MQLLYSAENLLNFVRIYTIYSQNPDDLTKALNFHTRWCDQNCCCQASDKVFWRASFSTNFYTFPPQIQIKFNIHVIFRASSDLRLDSDLKKTNKLVSISAAQTYTCQHYRCPAAIENKEESELLWSTLVFVPGSSLKIKGACASQVAAPSLQSPSGLTICGQRSNLFKKQLNIIF